MGLLLWVEGVSLLLLAAGLSLGVAIMLLGRVGLAMLFSSKGVELRFQEGLLLREACSHRLAFSKGFHS